MDDLEVEVRLENGAYYKGFVTNLFESEVMVAFEDDSQPQRLFGFELVRLPPVNARCAEDFQEGEEVEVYSQADDQEPLGWWLAVIKKIDNQKNVDCSKVESMENIKCRVEYLTQSIGKIFETHAGDKVRPKNTNPPIEATTFVQYEVEVSPELRDRAKTKGVQIFREGFQGSMHASFCRYVPEKGVLSILTRSRVPLLTNLIHKRYLELLRTKLHEEDCPAEMDEPVPGPHGDSMVYATLLQVRNDMMGLAIGKHGVNIQRARQVEKILFIQQKRNSNMFEIYGETKEAVERAKKTLQYYEDYVLVREEAVGRVVGKGGKAIQKVIEESGVVRMKINETLPHIPRPEGHIPLVFIGKSESVMKARSLLQKQLLDINEEKWLKNHNYAKEKKKKVIQIQPERGLL